MLVQDCRLGAGGSLSQYVFQCYQVSWEAVEVSQDAGGSARAKRFVWQLQ
jgi:hypothetical protein